MTAHRILEHAVHSFAPYLQGSGELHDPVFGEPTQYGTPYHAFCYAVLASRSNGETREAYAQRALQALRAALTHVADSDLPPTLSGFDRTTGTARRVNHRDFFWPPILRSYRLLKDIFGERIDEIGHQIAAVDIERSFRARPPSNWSAVWLSGEWRRMQEGLSPFTLEVFDRWLGEFFRARVLIERGFYQEPGHSNSYDLFTRVHLADIVRAGYDGRFRNEMDRLMETGLARSLAVQLSDGSLASAHRSTGQTWTVGAQCAYFMYAAWRFGNDAERRLQALVAAQRALAAFARWQRTDGPYSPVENCLPPGYRVGYEGYTADAHYASLAMGFFGIALLEGIEEGSVDELDDRQPSVWIEGDPVYRALAHHGPYTVHINAFPAPAYDGFGIVDLTFGAGRYLHFASSVRSVSGGRVFNLGMARRGSPGLSDLHVMAQHDYALVGGIRKAESPASLTLEGRTKGAFHTYRLTVRADAGGVEVEEATPGLTDYKTLLIPYVRNTGTGSTTEVREGRGEIRFELGAEEIAVTFDHPVDRVVHLPYGYENRRGLCGLVRVDFQERREGIAYRAARVR